MPGLKNSVTTVCAEGVSTVAPTDTATGTPELEISGLFTNFKVEAKSDELGDANFPPTLHAAAQLFVMTGKADSAKQLVKDVDTFIEVFKAGPDGVSSHAIGRGCVCWR